MFEIEIEIHSIDEVAEPGIKYWFVDENGSRFGTWIGIEQDKWLDNEFVVHYQAYRRQLYGFLTKGDCVRTWKTFGGALRYAKKHLPFS